MAVPNGRVSTLPVERVRGHGWLYVQVHWSGVTAGAAQPSCLCSVSAVLLHSMRGLPILEAHMPLNAAQPSCCCR